MFEGFRFGYSFSGFLVGTLVGMTGVGGGSLMTPILILFFGMRPVSAIGTDLIFAAVTKAFGTGVHGKLATVDWRIALWLALGSLPMTAVTIGLFTLLGEPGPAVNRAMKLVLGAAMVLTAASVAFRPAIVSYSKRRFGPWASARAVPLTIATGVLLGILVPLTSVGGGAIGMPILLLLYPGVSTARLVGADIAHAVPLTLVAGMGHLFVNPVDTGLLLTLLAGSIPGVVLGSFLSGKVPDGLLRGCLSIALVLAGWQMLK